MIQNLCNRRVRSFYRDGSYWRDSQPPEDVGIECDRDRAVVGNKLQEVLQRHAIEFDLPDGIVHAIIELHDARSGATSDRIAIRSVHFRRGRQFRLRCRHWSRGLFGFVEQRPKVTQRFR